MERINKRGPKRLSQSRTTLSRNLIAIRYEKKVTQKELANKSGISLLQITRIESGGVRDVKVSTLEAFADSLGVTLNDLWYPNSRELPYD